MTILKAVHFIDVNSEEQKRSIGRILVPISLLTYIRHTLEFITFKLDEIQMYREYTLR